MSQPANVYQNAKWKAPKLEEIKENIWYAISINPETECDHTLGIFKWYRNIYDSLLSFKGTVDLELFLECSPIGRFHFHGYVMIRDTLHYINFIKYLKKTSSFEIDTIGTNGEDIEKWKSYVTKQSKIWQVYFSKNVIGYPMKIYRGVDPISH